MPRGEILAKPTLPTIVTASTLNSRGYVRLTICHLRLHQTPYSVSSKTRQAFACAFSKCANDAGRSHSSAEKPSAMSRFPALKPDSVNHSCEV